VFGTGVLDDQTRELITVTVLACLQTLPQLKSHTAAALNVGANRSRSVRAFTSWPRSSDFRAR
jgi:alkylhydroperoxidase/carboxymuconolactone decarboxylase family protein YurZ